MEGGEREASFFGGVSEVALQPQSDFVNNCKHTYSMQVHSVRRKTVVLTRSGRPHLESLFHLESSLNICL